MKLFFWSFLFLLGCNPVLKKSTSVAELDLKISEEWIYATELSGLKYNNEIILRPPGFEQLVMQLQIPEKGGLSYKKHCVYYIVPYKEKIGALKIQELKDESACPDVSDDRPAFVSISGIDQLKINFSAFKLTLDFTLEKIAQKIEIPLPNIEAGLIHEKYRPLKEKGLISGLKLLRLNEDTFDFASNKSLGKLSDRFSRGNAIRCHQVNKDCETVGENRCDECRYGWYEVVDFQCAQGGSKFCGQNHCGEKNEPACPRGIKVVHPDDAGICQSDLEPVLNGDKILVCQ